MFALRFCVHTAAVGRPFVAAARGATMLAAAAIAMVPAACSQLPPSPAGPDPSDPQARTRPATYRPVIGPYASQRPVEPLPWRDQNDRIAPVPKPGQTQP